MLRIFHAYHVIVFHCDVQTEQMENEDAEGSQSDDGSDVGGDYDYLLGMALYTLTQEKKEELLRKRDDKLTQLKMLQTKSPASLWKEDLDMFLEQVSLDQIKHFLKRKRKNFPVHIHFMIAYGNQICFYYLHFGVIVVNCAQSCKRCSYIFFNYAVFMIPSLLCFLEDKFPEQRHALSCFIFILSRSSHQCLEANAGMVP